MSAKSKRRIKQQAEAGKQRVAPTGRSDRVWVAAAALALTLITLAIYWQTLGHGFVYDDKDYVTDNRPLHQGLTRESIAWAFTAMHSGNWHPLTWISHAADCQLYGLKPAGHHLTNLILHVANVLLLWLVLSRMTGAVWKSGFAAALFAVHPLRAESVAWVAERKDVLSTLFWLLTILAYARYSERPMIGRYALVLLAFAVGLMAKPMLVTLPLVLLVLDYWPLGRIGRREGRLQRGWTPLILEKAPLFALSAVSCVVTFVAQQKGGAMASAESYPVGSRIANALVAYARYLFKMVWPSGLAAHYPYVTNLPGWQVVGACIALIGVSLLVLRARRAYLAAGWLWYLVTLLPVIGLVQVGDQSAADRYTYIPLIGVFVMIAWGIPDLLGSRRSASGQQRPAVSAVLPALAVLVVLALSAAAWRQAGYWKDSKTLWQRALDVTENNARAHFSIGLALKEEGKLDEAARHYEAALKINPNCERGHAHNNLANVLAAQGRLDEAVYHYQEALTIDPRNAQAHNSFGTALFKLGKIEAAIQQFRKSLSIKPDQAEAHANLGIALGKQRKLDESIRHFREAIRLKPTYIQAHQNLAVVHYFKGDYADAWREVGLVRKYGGRPSPSLIQALSEKMPQPDGNP